MKKTIALFISGIIALCFSMSLSAQSSQQDLDQVELMKQFVGTWRAETGVDSIALWEIIPSDEGYIENIYWQAKGKTYSTGKGIIGFTWQYQTVNMYTLWQDGYLSRDMGKFVSDNKIILDRYYADHSHIAGTMDMKFLTPDKLAMIWKWRGDEQTWDNAVVTEYTWNRIKK